MATDPTPRVFAPPTREQCVEWCVETAKQVWRDMGKPDFSFSDWPGARTIAETIVPPLESRKRRVLLERAHFCDLSVTYDASQRFDKFTVTGDRDKRKYTDIPAIITGNGGLTDDHIAQLMDLKANPDEPLARPVAPRVVALCEREIAWLEREIFANRADADVAMLPPADPDRHKRHMARAEWFTTEAAALRDGLEQMTQGEG